MSTCKFDFDKTSARPKLTSCRGTPSSLDNDPNGDLVQNMKKIILSDSTDLLFMPLGQGYLNFQVKKSKIGHM